MFPHTITLPPPSDVTWSIQQRSDLFPISPSRSRYCGLIPEHNVRVPVHVSLTPAVKGKPPGSSMKPEISCVQSVPDWAEHRLPRRPAKFLSNNWRKKKLKEKVFFCGYETVRWIQTFKVEINPELTQNKGTTFTQTLLWSVKHDSRSRNISNTLGEKRALWNIHSSMSRFPLFRVRAGLMPHSFHPTLTLQSVYNQQSGQHSCFWTVGGKDYVGNGVS